MMDEARGSRADVYTGTMDLIVLQQAETCSPCTTVLIITCLIPTRKKIYRIHASVKCCVTSYQREKYVVIGCARVLQEFQILE